VDFLLFFYFGYYLAGVLTVVAVWVWDWVVGVGLVDLLLLSGV
jgi:hypothetical protein